MPKYGELIKQARKPENQEAIQPDNQNEEEPENQKTKKPDIADDYAEDLVNLCVKVSRPLRQHWAAEAKRKGVTMTEVIVDALSREFGRP